MGKDILYMGDTSLDTAAAYLAGVMTYYNIGFDYLASDKKPTSSLLDNDYKAIIVSDYPSGNFSEGQLNSIAEKISVGTGFLMIGGWDSFVGLGGLYGRTVLSNILPVVMGETYDRVNCASPCLIEKNCNHKIIDALPFDENTPGIGGYNRFKSKPGSTTILSSRRFQACRQNGITKFAASLQSDPLLVVGLFGRGNVAAFASDVAPHWVGGLVDWGDKRINARAPGAGEIEVGLWYAELFRNILKWVAIVEV
jgi:uncharacterized membrane protein